MQFAEIKANKNFQKFIILQKIVISIGNGECWVILHASLSSADFFFKINFFEKFFQEYHQSVKQFGSRSGPTIVGPDLGLNCLQKFSADDTSMKRVKDRNIGACS